MNWWRTCFVSRGILHLAEVLLEEPLKVFHAEHVTHGTNVLLHAPRFVQASNVMHQ